MSTHFHHDAEVVVLQVDVTGGHAVPPGQGFRIVADSQRSFAAIFAFRIVAVPVQVVIQHIVDQFRIFHANRDDVAAVCSNLLGIGFRIAGGASGPRNEDHVEVQRHRLGVVEGIVLVGVHDPGSDGREGHLAVTIQPAADVPAILFGDRIHHMINQVQILDELQHFRHFGRSQVLGRRRSHVGAVGQHKLHEVVSRPAAETVNVGGAVAVGILGQRDAVLTELFPGPFAAFHQITGIFQVRVFDHLQVESQRHGGTNHVLRAVGAQQRHSAAAGVDIRHSRVSAHDHRIVGGQHIAQIHRVAIGHSRSGNAQIQHVDVHVRRASQHRGVDGLLRARIGQVDALNAHAPLFFHALGVGQHHFVSQRAGPVGDVADLRMERVPVDVPGRADVNRAHFVFRTGGEGSHAQHHHHRQQESHKLFHSVLTSLVLLVFVSTDSGRTEGCAPCLPCAHPLRLDRNKF